MTAWRRARRVALGVTVAAVAVGLAGLVVARREPAVGPAPAVPAPPSALPTGASRPVWLRPVPPAIVLPPSDAIDEAVRPWQAGNYAGAALWLEALAKEHRDIPLLQFYAGAAWLLARVPSDAVTALEAALDAAPDDRRGEVAWYLGLAHLELDQHAAARQAFGVACGHGVPDACRAVAWVDARPPER